MYDIGFNTVRVQLATVQGASIPLPFGGKMAEIMVDLVLPMMLHQAMDDYFNAHPVVAPMVDGRSIATDLPGRTFSQAQLNLCGWFPADRSPLQP